MSPTTASGHDRGVGASASSSLSLTPEQQNAQMNAERAFLKKLLEAALQGNFDVLRSAVWDYCAQHHDLTAAQVLLQFKDGQKRTALHFACQSSTPQVTTSSTGTTTAADANKDADIVSRILSDFDFLVKDEGTIQRLLRSKDVDGLTPLMLACQQRPISAKRISSLLEFSTRRAPTTDESTSATTTTATLPKLGLARSKAGATALHYAAGAGASASILRIIYQAGAVALETFSLSGGTPLHWACSVPPPANNTETITTLIRECGANLHACSNDGGDKDGNSSRMIPPPLFMALAASNDVHAKCLLQLAMDNDKDHASSTITTTMMPTLEYTLQPGKLTVYHMAADMNMVGVLNLLLEATPAEQLSALVRRKNDQGLTPLQLAAKEGHVGCVLLLLPLEPNEQPQEETPLTVTEEDAQRYIAEFQKQWKEQAKSTEAQAEEHANPSTLHSPLPNKDGNSSSTSSDKDKAVEEDAKRAAAVILATAASAVSDADKKTAQEFKLAGNSHFAKKEWQLAADSYSQAIALDPTDATFYSNRSACYLQLPNGVDKALYDAVVCRSLKPDWPKGAYRMAMARLAQKRYEDAALSAWEGLQQDQDNAELKALLQKCVKQGRQEHQEHLQQKQQKKKNQTTTSTTTTTSLSPAS